MHGCVPIKQVLSDTIEQIKDRRENERGDIVRYLTQGNLMVAYEIIGHDDAFVDEKENEENK